MFVTFAMSMSRLSGWPPLLKELAPACGVGRGAASVAEERRATPLSLADEHHLHVGDESYVPGADVLVEGLGEAVRSRERGGERG